MSRHLTTLKPKKRKRLRRSYHPPDYLLAALAVGLTIFGIAMVYDASSIFAFEDFGDKYFFLKRQSVWAGLGLILGFIVSRIDYHFWKRLAKLGLIISAIFLLLVLLPGFSSEIYGARRRLNLPLGIPFMEQIGFQPSELAKLAIILFLASFLGEKPKTKQALLIFILVIAVFGGLIILEPDLGTTINLVGASLITLFLSEVPAILTVITAMLMGSAGAFFAFSSEYRRNRLLSFINPSVDKLGISYHINQVLIALGSGGLLGLGLGYSRQKYQYLPEVVTDSIFAVIGEELGFIGASLVVSALFLLVWRGLKCAEDAPDLFGKLLAGGITALVGLQIVLNLGSMVALVPLTGLPLPFISYGRSSLVINLVEAGMLVGISRGRRVDGGRGKRVKGKRVKGKG